MRGAVEVHRDLLAAQIRHEILHLTRVVADADDLPSVLGLPASACVAVRVYAAGGRIVAVAVPSGTWPDDRLLRRALHAQRLRTADLRPATSVEVSVATDQRSGLVCPVGLPPDVLLLADVALDAHRVVYTATGEGGTVLGVRTMELLALTEAQLFPLTTGGQASVAVHEEELSATGA